MRAQTRIDARGGLWLIKHFHGSRFIINYCPNVDNVRILTIVFSLERPPAQLTYGYPKNLLLAFEPWTHGIQITRFSWAGWLAGWSQFVRSKPVQNRGCFYCQLIGGFPGINSSRKVGISFSLVVSTTIALYSSLPKLNVFIYPCKP